VDLKSVYISPRSQKSLYDLPIEEELSAAYTHFGLACRKLGIRLIKAYSPQAKGRVERNHGVYQDRLVKRLKLEGLSTIEEGNQLLSSGFIEDLNRKFAKKPRLPEDKHRPVEDFGDLEQIFCWEYTRQVSNGLVIQFSNQYYQLIGDIPRTLRRKASVIVRRHMNDEISIWHNEKRLEFQVIAARPKVAKVRRSQGLSRSAIGRLGKAKSPWSRYE
jgi:hypothetical protein